MNSYIIIICFYFFTILGCQNNGKNSNIQFKKTKPRIDSVFNEKSERDSFYKQNINETMLLTEVVPDTTINNKLLLENYNSIPNFYSGNSNFKVIDNGTREAPVVIFSNKAGDQYLLAYQYEGGTKNSFDSFEIGYFENDKKLNQNSSYNVDDKIFETESKLGLGISLEKLIEIKGKNYLTKKDKDQLIITYRINDNKILFLKRYNMPGYFMEFTLKDDKVIKILFGFDYP